MGVFCCENTEGGLISKYPMRSLKLILHNAALNFFLGKKKSAPIVRSGRQLNNKNV